MSQQPDKRYRFSMEELERMTTAKNPNGTFRFSKEDLDHMATETVEA